MVDLYKLTFTLSKTNNLSLVSQKNLSNQLVSFRTVVYMHQFDILRFLLASSKIYISYITGARIDR